MKVLLVEPYHGGSHGAWAEGYRRHSEHTVNLISLPARFWKWRMHGAFLTLAEQAARRIDEDGPVDVILASSMMDVAAFAGAMRNVAPGVPIALYLHESQFTYPLSPADRVDLTYGMQNWASVATADLVIFNSHHHRDEFRREARLLLNGFPDAKHVHLIDPTIDASVVIPVGVETDALARRVRTPALPPLVVWNHRWEHDKGPDDLLAIAEGLVASEVPFTMAMCGEVFVSVPPTYGEVVDHFGDRLVHHGWLERDAYEELLASAAVVLSTAHHEFFGIGIVEGIAAGAHAVLPNRLVYPERIADLGGDATRSLYDDPAHAVELILHALVTPEEPRLRAATHRYDWTVVAPTLDAALSRVV